MTKIWLNNIYKRLLKYALIEDYFRFFSWRSAIVFEIVDNIYWLSSSKTKHRFLLSSIVIISLKPMLSCSNLSFSLVIASVIIGNLFDLITCSFWILNCINAVFSDLLSPIDPEFIDPWLRRWNIFVGIPHLYSAADISKVNSFTSASNSKSSSSSTFISSLSPLIPHFSKQFLIVKLVSSFHASCSHRIATSTKLKAADILTTHKKKDKPNIENYHPISILHTLSRISERCMHDQMYKHFDQILSKYQCGLHQGYNTHHCLLMMAEKWKEALDKGDLGAALLTDLSKAFDCINHDPLIAKLAANGSNSHSLSFIFSYLNERK